MIPTSHPRHHSLKQRELLVEGYKTGATALQGLIAYGRGEAFDYLIGEKTTNPANLATKAAAALLLTSENPVISVNGNTAVLCPRDLVKLSEALDAKLEINLFHRTETRLKVIERILRENGAKAVYGTKPTAKIKGIESERRRVDRNGIGSADVVLVALEDGDRTTALVDSQKKVIAVDLNPLSRTAKTASIIIVDNVIRAVPNLIRAVEKMRSNDQAHLEESVSSFENEKNLKDSLSEVLKGHLKP
jgi:4-phosphopantoate--beta-alanine ligase